MNQIQIEFEWKKMNTLFFDLGMKKHWSLDPVTVMFTINCIVLSGFVMMKALLSCSKNKPEDELNVMYCLYEIN